MTNEEAIKRLETLIDFSDGFDVIALKIAIKTLEQTKWIPVSERAAEFPCLACDIFKQIFIPSGIVVLNNRCYEGKDFDFNVEKFLKGKEITTCTGEKLYVKPREITAWMPLPEEYKEEQK